MHWILIVVMYAHATYGNGTKETTVTMQEFVTKAACENAASFINRPDWRPAAVVCVPKGK